MLTSNVLMLTHDSKADSKKLLKSGSDSLDTGIGITLRSTSDKKLKQSLANSVKDMDEYTKDFIYAQAKVQNKPATRKLQAYDVGDEVIVSITAIGHYVQCGNHRPQLSEN